MIRLTNVFYKPIGIEMDRKQMHKQTAVPESGSVLRHAVMLALVCMPFAVQAQSQPQPSVRGLDAHASGVFLNAGGDVLTARHAVARCKSIYVVKDGHVVEATVRTISHDLDLAVLGTSLKPYLSATLPLTMANTGSTVGVFAEAYSVLQRLPDRANLLSNAMTIPSDDGLQMLSGVKPGASGSGVLSGTGLLLGVVVERVGSTSGTGSVTSTTMLSRATAAGAPAGATLVRAIGITQVKEFLREGDIVFTESDAAQLGPQQSPAARAATLSVGIICG
jgi:hypothetical protein